MSDLLKIAESFGVDLTTRGTRQPAQKVAEAVKLLQSAWSGDPLARVVVNEALTTSDAFARTIGDIWDREINGTYPDAPAEWQKIATRTTVRDFNPKKIIDLIGSAGALTLVPEHTNYPEADYKGVTSMVSLRKYGEQFGYTWEMKLADRLDELKLVPNRWMFKAQRTTDLAVLSPMVNTVTGAPNTAMFNATNTNLYSGGLTAENLQAVMTAMGTRRDSYGNLIPAVPLQLVVGPSLQFVAKRLLSVTEYRTSLTGTLQVLEQNPFSGVPLQVMSGIPGDAWFVMPVPGQTPRPALYAVFLAGHETPQVRYKNDQGKLPSGADLGVDEGSFDDDTCYWRIRHVSGGGMGDPTFTAAVTGGSGTTALTKTGW